MIGEQRQQEQTKIDTLRPTLICLFHPTPEVFHTQTGLPALPHPTWTSSHLAAVTWVSVRQLHGYWDSSEVSSDSLDADASVPPGTKAYVIQLPSLYQVALKSQHPCGKFQDMPRPPKAAFFEPLATCLLLYSNFPIQHTVDQFHIQSVAYRIS